MRRNNENKKSKKTIKHVIFGLLIGVVTIIGIWQLLSFQTRIQQQQQREKIALWVVQNVEGPEPIKEIKVGKVIRNGIGGTGGSSVSVKINNNERDSFNFLVDGDIPESDGYVYDSKTKYVVLKKKNKRKTLKGVKVEEWKYEKN